MPNRLTHSQYVVRISAKFGSQIRVVGTYVNQLIPILHHCADHDEFLCTPDNMMNRNKYGCPVCSEALRAISKTKTHDDVVSEIFTRTFGEIILMEQYKGSRERHRFSCLNDHMWWTTPDSVLRGSGCPTCMRPKMFSQKAVRWLEMCAKRFNCYIEHAANGEEKRIRIPGFVQPCKVDGFCADTNTVFEFYGDMWHGNPAVYGADAVLIGGKTAKELYERTKRREAGLIELGYRVIFTWETQFDEFERLSSVTVPAYASAVTDPHATIKMWA